MPLHARPHPVSTSRRMTATSITIATSLAMALTACAGAHPSVAPETIAAYPEAAEVLPPRMIQVEGGVTMTRAGEELTTTLGELRTRFGVAPHVEGRVALNPISMTSSPDGREMHADELVLGAKITVLRATGAPRALRPELAVLVEAPVSTAPTERERFTEPSLRLVARWALSPRLGVGASSAATTPVGPDGRRVEYGQEIALDADVFHGIRPHVEYGAEWSNASQTPARALSGGITVDIGHRSAFDVRVGVAQSHAPTERSIRVGFGQRW